MHWVTGKDGDDVAQVPAGPAGRAGRGAGLLRRDADPDFLLEVEHVRAWEAEHGPLPDGGWLLYRTGWDARSEDAAAFLNADETGPHTPGHLGRRAPAGWPRSRRCSGSGWRRSGTDAGAAHSFDPPFPCHSFLLGAGKYGLTQLQNLARLPATGAVVIAGPLPIVERLRQPGPGAGAGRAVDVMATVAELVGRALAGLGVGHAFGVVGSGNFHVTNALRAAGVPFVAARHEGGAATMADAYARTSGRVGVLSVHQGCGLTNAMTGITEAAKSRTPMLVLAADTGAAAVRSNFRIDQAALVARGGRGGRAGAHAGVRGGRHGAGLPDRGRAAAHRGAQPAAGRAGRRRRRTRRPVPRAGPRSAPLRPAAATRCAALAALLAAARSGRCSWPAAGRRGRPGRAARRWPRRPARCWPPRPWRTGCSTASRGRWASPAGSPPRWPPS